jgi:hypothetical protein
MLQRAVNADVASSHDQPVAETVDNARRQQGPTKGVEAAVLTGRVSGDMMRTTARQLEETLDARRAKSRRRGTSYNREWEMEVDVRESDRVILEPLRVGALQHVDHEAFGFLGFDLRRVHKRTKDGYTIQRTPKKKARKAMKAKIRDIIRSGGVTPVT